MLGRPSATFTWVEEVRCFGCGATVPTVDGPVHPYMLAEPGCWALYGALQDWKLSQRGTDSVAIVQLVVGTYACQHATNADRRNRQSVAVHLMSLCASLEQGLPAAQVRDLMGGWTHREYPILLPRPDTYPVTVRDIADCDVAARRGAVTDWATSTWAAWSVQHDQVRWWLPAKAWKQVRPPEWGFCPLSCLAWSHTDVTLRQMQ